MPINKRIVATVTRSISFDETTFAEMEARREVLGIRDRSKFMRAVIEEQLGIAKHPEIKLTPAQEKMLAENREQRAKEHQAKVKEMAERREKHFNKTRGHGKLPGKLMLRERRGE